MNLLEMNPDIAACAKLKRDRIPCSLPSQFCEKRTEKVSAPQSGVLFACPFHAFLIIKRRSYRATIRSPVVYGWTRARNRLPHACSRFSYVAPCLPDSPFLVPPSVVFSGRAGTRFCHSLSIRTCVKIGPDHFSTFKFWPLTYLLSNIKNSQQGTAVSR